MRVSLKRGALILIGSVIIAVAYITYHSSYSELVTFYQDLLVQDKYDIASFSAADRQLKQSIHYKNYLYSGYEDFTKLYNGNTRAIKKLTLADKCNTFFTQFSKKNPEWKFSDYQNEIKFDRGVTDKHRFFKDQYDELKKKKEEDGDPEPEIVTEQEKERINEKFEKMVKSTKLAQQGAADTTTLSRIYGQCFLHNDDPHIDRETFKTYSAKLFPFFNKALPTFQRLGKSAVEGKGETKPEWMLPANTLPIFNNKDEFTGKYSKYNPETDDIVDFLHKKSSGRGIVLSASTKQTGDMVKLIRVLRALNNKLPIQIVFRGDIDENSKEVLEYAATKDIDFLLNPDMASEHTEYLPDLKLMEHYKEYGSEFPAQDIWLVNIVDSIDSKDLKRFNGFLNKILAYTMNSFKEMILLDADTVPLVPIADFFDSEEYKRSGTFFFKDRALRYTNDYLHTNYLSQLFHTNEISMDSLFGIPKITDKTMSNPFMTGWTHFQEAGVVALNRYDHFLGVLLTFHLSLWGEPASSGLWGDKEMYWVGLAMAGDENYEFNEFSAASVGELTKNVNLLHYTNTTSQELCSTHPGHVDKNGKLLWINSGFLFCKTNGYEEEEKKFPFTIFETENLKNLFNDPIKLRAALVPPDMPKFREPYSPIDFEKERAFSNSWDKRPQDFDQFNYKTDVGETQYGRFDDNGPQKGWVTSNVCHGYYYCAYNEIASYETPGEIVRGHVFEFTTEQGKMYDYLGKIWVTGNLRIAPPAPPAEPVEAPAPEKSNEEPLKESTPEEGSQ